MKNLLVLLILFLSVFGYSQESDSYKFIENKGQWNKNVQFKTDIEGGALYLESNKLTYSFYDEEALESYFHAHNSHAPKKGINPIQFTRLPSRVCWRKYLKHQKRKTDERILQLLFRS